MQHSRYPHAPSHRQGFGALFRRDSSLAGGNTANRRDRPPDYAGTVGREAQLRIFREQLDWAERLGKPVVLHCVKAFEAVMRELAPHALRAVIFHGFIGSSQQAAEAVKRGYYLSFGERTFRSPRTVEALRRTPVENLFAETDESDVPIEEIYRRIAQAKDLDPEMLKCAIYRNYREIFEQ